ncbi:hypothetical protein SNE40_013516 [Patella caerulea]|uniref:Uncharacterized protein n=1 Tax=Patella caerulea TaxID=87958 RepID=A0AAN8JG28_PATCE
MGDVLQLLILITIISCYTGDVFYSNTYGFGRFLNISLVDHFTINAKFTGNLNVAFYSSSSRLLGMYLHASKYAIIGYPATNFPVPLPSPTDYNTYWFKYGNDKLIFGLGSEPETDILGELPMNTNSAVMYAAFSAYQPNEVFVKFPDTASKYTSDI